MASGKWQVGLLIWLLLTCMAAADQQTNAIVRKIRIEGNRARDSVVRRELAFREGDVLTPEKIEKSKENLDRLGLLKELTIEQEWVEELEGLRVTIHARDGWFVLPWPVFGSSGGEYFGALALFEHNIFRRSEGIMVLGFQSEDTETYLGGFFLPRAMFFGGWGRTSLVKYQYADGAYSSKDFSGTLNTDLPEDFGEIINRYDETITRTHALVGARLPHDFRLALRLDLQDVEYGNTSVSEPADEGPVNSMAVSAAWGEGMARRYGGGEFLGGFGRIFGLGLAGLRERLRTRDERLHKQAAELTFDRGDPSLGSMYAFSSSSLSVSHTTVFRNWNSLSGSLTASTGRNLPQSRLLATTADAGLRGTYAREYRGDSLLGATASYQHPLVKNRVGYLATEVFADQAVCWVDGHRWDQQGIGVSVAYQFWRFPLPLGGGYTYNIGDRNWQAGFAVGGMY